MPISFQLSNIDVVKRDFIAYVSAFVRYEGVVYNGTRAELEVDVPTEDSLLTRHTGGPYEFDSSSPDSVPDW